MARRADAAARRAAAATTSRAPRSTSTRARARRAGLEDVTRPPPTRRVRDAASRQRHVRVRRCRGASSTASRGSGSSPAPTARAAAARWRCCSPAREPVAALAARRRSRSPTTPSWDALELAGVRATIEAPLRPLDGALRRRRTARASSSSSRRSARPPSWRRDAGARSAGWHGYEQPCRVRGTRARRRAASATIDALGQRGHAWGDAGLGRGSSSRAPSRRGPTTALRVALTAVRPAAPSTTPTRRSGPRCWEPEALLEIADGRALDDLRRRRPHSAAPGSSCGPRARSDWARRGAGEVLCGTSLDLGRAAARLRVLPLAPGGPRGRRPLRRAAPRSA